VLEAPIPPPSQRRSEIPPELDRIVKRALERDLERRYRNADELADDLEGFLRHQPAENQPIKKLIGHLFHDDDSRNSTTLPAIAAMTSVTVVSTASRSISDPAVTPAPMLPRTSAIIAKPRAIRRNALAWCGGASLLIAATAITLAAGRPSSHPGGDGKAGATAQARSGDGEARLEVSSEPAGATVYGSRGFLGTTPMIVNLPISSQVERLRFEKPGFAAEIYDVHPRSGGFVFVELQKVRPNAEGSTQDGLEDHR
jgi:hypothetical protein